ncbi:hypothetical protein [Melissospora conviva]|uniref:hypothetical protein n=1 Tax=Melissospora conviva TaxID=3388432 RepID=UPI003C1FDFF3
MLALHEAETAPESGGEVAAPADRRGSTTPAGGEPAHDGVRRRSAGQARPTGRQQEY